MITDTSSSTRTIIRAAFVIVVAIWISGCSAYMAANQPPPKNFAVLKQRTVIESRTVSIGPYMYIYLFAISNLYLKFVQDSLHQYC